MAFAWYLWEMFINCLECFFFYYLLLKQLGYKKQIYAYAGLLFMIVCETALNFSSLPFIVTTLSMLALRVIYSLLCFNGNYALRILWGISGTLVTQATNLIISNLLPLFSGFDIVDTLSPSPARFGVQVFYILIVITLYWILSRTNKRKNLSAPVVLQIFTVLIMALGVYAVGKIVGFAIGINQTPEDRQVLVTISFAILIMLVAIVLLFDKISKIIYEKAEIENQLRITALEEESVKRSKEMISVWKHDMHNNFEILRYYAAKNDLENLRKKLGDINADFESITAIQSTGNPSVDACISSKIIVAHANQIPTSLNISRINGFPMSESELCVILGNLLTNCIEACEKITDPDERYIDLSIFQMRDMIYIDILNSSDGSYQSKNKKLITSKKEPNHGWGLSNMERNLKKHNCFYEIDPGSNYFQVRIFIPSRTEY